MAVPSAPRSPFMPVRKHGSKGSLSPPASPSSSIHSHRPSGGTTPLLPSTVHNVPSFTIQSSTPPAVHQTSKPLPAMARPTTPGFSRKVLPTPPAPPSPIVAPTSTFQASNSPLSTAPRIRAKVTAVATPRKKALLPGTENVEFASRTPPALAQQYHAPGHGLPGRPLIAERPMTPMRSGVNSQSAAGFGAFPGTPVNAVTASPFRQELRTPVHDSVHASMTLHAPDSLTVSGREFRSAKGKDNVLVCVRVRPPAAKLVSSNAVVDDEAWNADETSGRVQLKTGAQDSLFDSVVTGSDNANVYEEAGKDLVLAAMEGFDSVIFAYGQTASGKTFTLTGNPSNPGIIPQSVTDIFAYIREHPEQEFLLRASYLEIYNETLKDLLAPESGALRIRQDEKKRFFVSPLREEVVTHEAQVAALLRRGETNRSIGATDFNETSSRSHSLFQMTIESRARDDTLPSSNMASDVGQPGTPRLASNCAGPVRMSRLSLIDLAGSEQATSQAERRSEGAFINKSLLTLEKVIASLTEDSKRKPHVPYRDSKLTQILQPSLSGDARVSVIATINPSPMAVEESKSTLKFATRVKKVQLKAIVNEVIDDKALITKYRAEIARLHAALQVAQSNTSAPGTPTSAGNGNLPAPTAQMQEMQEQLSDLRSLIVTSRDVGDRRRSLLPPRPVSPMKAYSSSRSSSDSMEPSLSEKLVEAQDEVVYLKSENADLKSRISELEDRHLEHLRSTASDSTKDARIAQLVKENQEMLVIVKNMDNEGDMKRLETRFKREIEKRAEVERRLRDEIEFERGRIAKMEKFIIDRIQTSYDLILGKIQPNDVCVDGPDSSRHSSLAPPDSTGQRMPSSVSRTSLASLAHGSLGFLPIISERSMLADTDDDGDALLSIRAQEHDGVDGGALGVSEDDDEFGRLEFLSKETRDTLKKSGSMLFVGGGSGGRAMRRI